MVTGNGTVAINRVTSLFLSPSAPIHVSTFSNSRFNPTSTSLGIGVTAPGYVCRLLTRPGRVNVIHTCVLNSFSISNVSCTSPCPTVHGLISLTGCIHPLTPTSVTHMSTNVLDRNFGGPPIPTARNPDGFTHVGHNLVPRARGTSSRAIDFRCSVSGRFCTSFLNPSVACAYTMFSGRRVDLRSTRTGGLHLVLSGLSLRPNRRLLSVNYN